MVGLMLQKNIIKFPVFCRMGVTFGVSALIATVLLMGLSPTFTFAQSEEMEVLEQVNDLLEQLKGDDIGLRDEAEAAFADLPPDALDYIDVPDDNATTDYIERLLRARKALEAKAVALAVKPSVVNLESDLSIDKALKSIFEQTGNQILLNEDIARTTRRKKIARRGSSSGSPIDQHRAAECNCRHAAHRSSSHHFDSKYSQSRT